MSKLYLLTRCATTISALRCDAKAAANSVSSWAGDISTRLFVRRRFLARGGAGVASLAGGGDSAGDPAGGRGRVIEGMVSVLEGTTGVERFGAMLSVCRSVMFVVVEVMSIVNMFASHRLPGE